MVHNRIKVMRAETDISATTLAGKMPKGVDKIVMSYIENGRVLPTRDGLEAMCDVFGCIPTDIYNADDIDLLAVKRKAESEQPLKPGTVKVRAVLSGENPRELIIQSSPKDLGKHEGMEQLRVWMNAEEKAALFKVVEGLGYHSVAEWLREMYRVTLHKYISLNLNNKALHESIPPTTQNQTIGS